MSKINKEIAEQEVAAWLDYKKVSAKKREKQQDSIESLVEAIEEGYLVLSDDKTKFIQNLRFEYGNESKFKKLEYKSRVSVANIKPKLANVKATDIHGTILAYVSALTGQDTMVIADLDTEDYDICKAIAIFFL